ncbi:putative nucleic acid-binding protein [Clostridium beijerinckii]|uniref:PIN domain-containing protein n=1 Tax=Clostridium beijerinckii TaxID=1520 RepID=UPI001493F78A|nr:PIN domain-containing protein [Clostridium beijerinckii]NOW85903.1 putative nucleic acid-binding protein [Clostridium beijerinckii]
MGTNFIDFNNPQNNLNNCDIIVLDTCSLINLASGDQDALNFAQFTLDNNITLCYTVKSVEELQINKEAQTIPKNKQVALPNMTSYLQQSYLKADAILTTVNSLPNMYDEPIGNINNGVLQQAKINAINNKLRWGDAIIYTLTKQSNFNYIWTFDKDWSNVVDNDMNILTMQRFIPNNGVINLANNIVNS